jgi:membrane-associated phospholipid phosphatase
MLLSTILFRSRASWASIALASMALVVAAEVPAHADPYRVEWSDEWPRFHLWEGIDTLVFGVGSFVVAADVPPATSAHVSGGILFDNSVRNALRGRTASLQGTAATATDVLYFGSIVPPFLIDAWIVTFGIHQRADVGTEMALVDAQALGVAGFVSLVAEKTVGRARPFIQDCSPDGVVRDASGQPLLNRCNTPEDFQSFFSGHSAVTAAMAGVTCVHHQHLPLYGGGAADLAPCLLMIGVSATTGVGRLVADKHWATDVITGWSVGFLSGYVMPSLVHYGFGRGGRPYGQFRVAGAEMVPVPGFYAGGAGMGVLGIF